MLLQSLDNPKNTPIDWYGAQAPPNGTDQTDGVARTLVSTQDADGSWFSHNYDPPQYYFETAWAITMLNKTVFQPVPVACATATPNPVASGGPVLLDGSCSYHLDPTKQIVQWQWDVSGTAGTNFTLTGVKVTTNLTAPPNATLPYNYPVRLRVTDNGNPALTADFVFNVVISNPPRPPTANAGGPYNFCPAASAVWTLDGSQSVNPDDGQHEPNAPPSQIIAYDWDFSCSNTFNDAHGVRVNVTSAFANRQGQSFNVCLRVTNNDNLAYPSAGLTQGLSSVGSAQVFVHTSTDPQCAQCVNTLQALRKAGLPGAPGNIQLYWLDTSGAATSVNHYNVYRSTTADFSNFIEIAGATSTYGISAVAVPVNAGSAVYFQDTNVQSGTTYYYRVSPATVNDSNICSSNITVGVAISAGRQ
jgi:hypothetical protein